MPTVNFKGKMFHLHTFRRRTAQMPCHHALMESRERTYHTITVRG